MVVGVEWTTLFKDAEGKEEYPGELKTGTQVEILEVQDKLVTPGDSRGKEFPAALVSIENVKIAD